MCYYNKMLLKMLTWTLPLSVLWPLYFFLIRTMQHWSSNKLMRTNKTWEKRLYMEFSSQKTNLMTSAMNRLGSWRNWWTRLPNLIKKSPFLKTQNTKPKRLKNYFNAYGSILKLLFPAVFECDFCEIMDNADTITYLKLMCLAFCARINGKLE